MGRNNKHESPQMPQSGHERIDVNAVLASMREYSSHDAFDLDDMTEGTQGTAAPEFPSKAEPEENIGSFGARTGQSTPSEANQRADSARRLRAMLSNGPEPIGPMSTQDKLRAIQARLAELRGDQHQSMAIPPLVAQPMGTIYPEGYIPQPGNLFGGYPYGYPYGHQAPEVMPMQQGVSPGPLQSPSDQGGQYDRDDASPTEELPVTTNGLPSNPNDEEKQETKKFRLRLPNRENKPARVVAGVAVVALLGGGAVGGAKFISGKSEASRLNMIKEESAKFQGGLMSELLNCENPENALNLQMTTVTQSGLSAKVRMQTREDKKEAWGRFPTSARMVANTAIALCASKSEENTGKPFAHYENGQWHVNRSAIVIDSVGKLKVPTCDRGEIEGNAPGCTVPTPKAWYDGDKKITPENKESYSMTEADNKWSLELIADKPELNDTQKQFMSDATLQLYTKGLGMFDVAGNSCSAALDSHMSKLVQELSRKKYSSVPENQQVAFEGNYGSLAARTLGGVIGEANGKPITVTDRLSKSFVEVDDSLKTECHVMTADETKASTAPPPQASPPAAAHTSRS